MGLEYFGFFQKLFLLGFSVLIKLSNSFIKLVIHFKPAVSEETFS